MLENIARLEKHHRRCAAPRQRQAESSLVALDCEPARFSRWSAGATTRRASSIAWQGRAPARLGLQADRLFGRARSRPRAVLAAGHARVDAARRADVVQRMDAGELRAHLSAQVTVVAGAGRIAQRADRLPRQPARSRDDRENGPRDGYPRGPSRSAADFDRRRRDHAARAHSAYQVFASGGVQSPSYALEAVIDAKGHLIYKHEDAGESRHPSGRRVSDHRCAQRCSAYGTGASAAARPGFSGGGQDRHHPGLP